GPLRRKGDDLGPRVGRCAPLHPPGDDLGALHLSPPTPLRRHHHHGGPPHAAGHPRRAPAEIQPAAHHLMEPILVVDRVVKRFGGVTAINGASLSLKAGHIHGLTPPTGSAKTTPFTSLT